MAVIRPFKALRYSPAAGDVRNLISPPYGILSRKEKEEYLQKNPYNIMHLTLPTQEMGDRSKFVKYARSAAKLAQWRREEQLILEKEPSFYSYTQKFIIPGTQEVCQRQSLVTLLKLEPYEKGIVLPHEQTFPTYKEDRLRLLEATGTHFESIFGLYEGEGSFQFLLENTEKTLLLEVQTEDGVHHRLERISNLNTLRTIAEWFQPKKIWIADGHHRYETALKFRAKLDKHPQDIGADYIMIALSDMQGPGLVILPTHRVIERLPYKASQIKQILEKKFCVRPTPLDSIPCLLAQTTQEGSCAFGLLLKGESYVIELREPKEAYYDASLVSSKELQLLDVSLLHKIVFQELLQIQAHSNVFYTRDTNMALASVNDGAAAAFLLNPPTLEDVRRIALRGEKMPPKSTFYYPKIISGLFMWSMTDFE